MLSVENRPLVMTCSTAESPGIIAAKRPWRSGEYARDKDRDAGAGATRSLLSSRWVTTAFAARPIARRAAPRISSSWSPRGFMSRTARANICTMVAGGGCERAPEPASQITIATLLSKSTRRADDMGGRQVKKGTRRPRSRPRRPSACDRQTVKQCVLTHGI